jgi:golgi SNAP receptor complex member 2
MCGIDYISCAAYMQARTELLSTSASLPSPSDARRRFPTSPNNMTDASTDAASSPFRSPAPPGQVAHALREHTFLQETESRLDDFIAQGREVLDGLVDQRNMLKGTQRRLLDAANTLGLSRDVIGWIERRR